MNILSPLTPGGKHGLHLRHPRGADVSGKPDAPLTPRYAGGGAP
jgi:hypothetical protein